MPKPAEFNKRYEAGLAKWASKFPLILNPETPAGEEEAAAASTEVERWVVWLCRAGDFRRASSWAKASGEGLLRIREEKARSKPQWWRAPHPDDPSYFSTTMFALGCSEAPLLRYIGGALPTDNARRALIRNGLKLAVNLADYSVRSYLEFRRDKSIPHAWPNLGANDAADATYAGVLIPALIAGEPPIVATALKWAGALKEAQPQHGKVPPPGKGGLVAKDAYWAAIFDAYRAKNPVALGKSIGAYWHRAEVSFKRGSWDANVHFDLLALWLHCEESWKKTIPVPVEFPAPGFGARTFFDVARSKGL